MMKVLINTPNYHRPQLGGVANHYYGLKPYWSVNVRYNIVGSRNRPGRGKYYFVYDLVKTLLIILFWRPNIVVVNPSLAPNAIKRDSIFLNLAHFMGCRTLAHFHGFNPSYAKEISSGFFMRKFKNADAFVVLSSDIKKQMREWGVGAPIYMGTTKVDDRMLEGFNVDNRVGRVNNILYLGRIETEKGIYLALDIFSLLKQSHPELRFSVIGGGSELENVKLYAASCKISDIVFTGPLSGKDLVAQYINADLYLFTSFHEGMPTSVLEAMCFGLPVVTRPVGGLVDFFEGGKMGAMVNSLNAEDFIPHIEDFINNPEKTAKVSIYNNQYGREHFLATEVAKKMEQIFREILASE